jgi:peptidyl-prolyl cis-trans isomerase B (cyclophilin B)
MKVSIMTLRIMRKSRFIAVAVAALALGATGVGSASALAHAPSRPGTARSGAARTTLRSAPGMLALGPGKAGPGVAAAAGCGFTKAVPFDRFKGLPNFTAKRAARHYTARLHTTQGLIVVRARTKRAPCTTFSFRFLAQRNFYTGTHCHRLTTQGIFVLQCGDPTGTGSGGPGYRFNDENLTGATYPAGTVAMANAGPNTNGSQFFFVWKDTKLPPDYTPFATVTRGLGILKKIAAAGDDSQNGAGDGYPHRFTAFRHIGIVFSR